MYRAVPVAAPCRYGMAASKIRIYGSGEGPQSSDGTSLSLLESFANNNQNLEQCVGHMFTSQNFQGTLGLASKRPAHYCGATVVE